MLDAMRMQLPRGAWASRALAALLASCVVLAGLWALRHETRVTHVRDRLTGQLRHAHELAEYHAQDTTPHLHGRDVDAHAETGGCTLLAALDQATILPGVLAFGHGRLATHVTPSVPLLDPASPAGALYLLAPKTSPPSIV